jgi:hypothetical protein
MSALAMLVGVMAAAAVQTAPLQCRLEAAPRQRAGGPVMVRLVLRNASRRALSVLSWGTPLEGLLSDAFVIREAGAGASDPALAYAGPMIKRGDPERDEYVRIAPRGETSAEVDLALAYDLARPGRYTIAFRGRLADVTSSRDLPRPRARLEPRDVACAPLHVELVAP